MAKVKYAFNPESLSYQKVEGNSLKSFFTLVLAAFVIGLVLFFVASYYFPTPSERALKRENNQLLSQFDVFQERLKRIETVLLELEKKDEQVYREIFEADPIPLSIRNAGFGGVNRYEKFNGYEHSPIVKNTAKQLDVITKRLVVQSKSFDEIKELISDKNSMLANIPAIQPVSGSDLKHLYGFGPRIDPVYKTPAFHKGLDFSAPLGTKVYATGSGLVIDARYSQGGFGKKIEIDHGYGYKTVYAHLSKILVRAGDQVQRGDVIGLVGNTGKSVGAHLHYEVHKNGRALDPINFFYDDLSPEEYDQMIKLAAQSAQPMD